MRKKVTFAFLLLSVAFWAAPVGVLGQTDHIGSEAPNAIPSVSETMTPDPLLSSQDDPLIVIVPNPLILSPSYLIQPVDVQPMFSLVYDLNPPFIVALAWFSATSAVPLVGVLSLDAFGFTYPISLPNGAMEIGWGIGAVAWFAAVSPGPFPLFLYGGNFCTYSLDFEGNQSFACGPVLVWST